MTHPTRLLREPPPLGKARTAPLVIGLAWLRCLARCSAVYDEREHELTMDRHGTVRARCPVCGGTEGYAMGLAAADPQRRAYREQAA